MKSKWSLWLLTALLAIGLVACGNGDEPTPAATEPSGEEPTAEPEDGGVEMSGTVTFWHAYGTGSAEETAITEIVENARAAYPDLTIDVLQIPFDQIFNKWETEVAAGGGPDMFIAPNDNLGNQARAGVVMDITDQLEGMLEGIVDTGVAGMEVDGRMYGVPESAKAVALYYNKSMVETPPATMDELMAEVENGNIIVQNQNAYHLFGMFTAFGGDILSSDGATACPSGEEPFVEAMQFLVDLKAAGGLFETDGGRADTLFRNGEVAMIINGPWVLGDYRADLGDDLGVAPIPEGTAPGAAFNGIDGFYINPNSENPDLAIALALYLTNQESAQIYSDVAGHVPIREDVEAPDDLVAGFAAASNQGYPRPQSEAFGSYWAPFGDMVTKVLEGTMSPEDGVAEACANYQTAIGD